MFFFFFFFSLLKNEGKDWAVEIFAPWDPQAKAKVLNWPAILCLQPPFWKKNNYIEKLM